MDKNFTNDTLLARWLSGELTDAETKELRERPDFPAFEKLVADVEQLRPPDYDAPAALARLKAARAAQGEPAAKVVPLPKRRNMLRWASAAAVLLLVATAWFLLPAGELLFTAERGTMTAATLPDGSVVQLNAESELRFSDQSDKRLAVLVGEGYFEVQKMEKPFVVSTQHLEVTVLGTSFNVTDRAGLRKVSCNSGLVRVAFTGQAEEFLLTAGEAVVLLPTGTAQKIPADEETDLDWIAGRSAFNQVPLTTVLAEMERQFDLQFILAPTLDQTQLITTAFPNDEVDKALEIVLNILPGFGYEKSGQAVTIYAQ
ncbi:MAG: FecR domain-containing protein [Bacteroidota bacterium]